LYRAAGWLDHGGQIRTPRSGYGTRQVPNRIRFGGYDLAVVDVDEGEDDERSSASQQWPRSSRTYRSLINGFPRGYRASSNALLR